MPSVPSTLAISWGSATTAVVPCARTARANSATIRLDHSMCMCPSMKPGTRYAPETSSRSPPSYRPSPTTWPSLTATSTSSHSFVNTERTLPPDSTRSAGSSPRATAIQCASMTERIRLEGHPRRPSRSHLTARRTPAATRVRADVEPVRVRIGCGWRRDHVAVEIDQLDLFRCLHTRGGTVSLRQVEMGAGEVGHRSHADVARVVDHDRGLLDPLSRPLCRRIRDGHRPGPSARRVRHGHRPQPTHTCDRAAYLVARHHGAARLGAA